PRPAFKRERLGDDGNSQGSNFFGYLGDDGCPAGTGSPAHSRRNENHIGAVEQAADFLSTFLGSPLADLRIGPCAQTAGQLLPQPHLLRCQAAFQGLSVRIHGDEAYAFQFGLDHAIDGVAPASADADDTDFGQSLSVPVQMLHSVLLPTAQGLLTSDGRSVLMAGFSRGEGRRIRGNSVAIFGGRGGIPSPQEPRSPKSVTAIRAAVES